MSQVYYASYAPWSAATASNNTPRANAWTEDSGTKIEIELPGFSRSDIDISTKKGRLTVTAKREKISDTKNCFIREFAETTLTRSWALPKNTNYDGITADLDSGILTITVPHTKVEDTTARRIQIG